VSMPPVWMVPKGTLAAFRAELEKRGLAFEDRLNQVLLARAPGVSVNLYANGTVVLGGSDGAAIRKVEAILEQLGATRSATSRPAPDALESATGTRIGTDESGKGDYFGPLVVAGVLVTPETEATLKQLGVRDSKTLSDARVAKLAPEIRRVVGPAGFDEVVIGPEKYNQLHDPTQTVNAILAWGHARALENILAKGPPCELAIADQFGDERYIKQALMAKGRQVRLLQTPKGERDMAVAAASVLARDRFVRSLAAMGDKWGFEFPKGSSQVVEAGVAFVAKFGEEALSRVAKVHFGTTGAVLARAHSPTLPRPTREKAPR
jgi:ribonuclease HIII